VNVRDNQVHIPIFTKSNLPLALVLLGSAALRLVHLDYSHFQGDELSALYPLDMPFPESLIEQLKGPVQLVITFAVRALTGEYGEWQTRLPFSIASLFTVYIIYIFVRDFFGHRPALWAAALTGSCGLLVAFGRIVQYQAIVMLSVSATALFLLHWIQKDDSRSLYYGLGSYAIGVLSHYDSLTFLPALLLLLILGFRSRERWTWSRLRHLLFSGLFALFLAGMFYVPFILRPGFGSVTNYLQDRVIGGSVRATFVQTGQLLDLYFPPFYLRTILVLLLLGTAKILWDENKPIMLVILAWFAAPFAFYMLLGGDPRSHVYMYFLPAMILAALGIEGIISLVNTRVLVQVAQATAWAVIIVFASFTYYMMVDHSIEHPWERKTVFGYELPNLETGYIQGVFGFPYNRNLEQVGELFRSGRLHGTVDSNERYSTVEFYFNAPRSSPPVTYFDDPGSSPPDYYFYVRRPFSLRRKLPETVEETYQLFGTIQKGERTTVDMYAAPWKDPQLLKD
jgi:4-amino-4-deoxy-L-arabinose transferase-like glycosyltransferase